MKYKTKRFMSFNNMIKYNQQDLQALTKLENINNKKINKFEQNAFMNKVNILLFPALITVFFNGLIKNMFLEKGTLQTTEAWETFKGFLATTFNQPTPSMNVMKIMPNSNVPIIENVKYIEPLSAVNDLANINSFSTNASLIIYTTLLASFIAGFEIRKHKLNKRAKNLNLALERMEDRTKEDF